MASVSAVPRTHVHVPQVRTYARYSCVVLAFLFIYLFSLFELFPFLLTFSYIQLHFSFFSPFYSLSYILSIFSFILICRLISGWTGSDCSERLCPSSVAWFGYPAAQDTAHISGTNGRSGKNCCVLLFHFFDDCIISYCIILYNIMLCCIAL